MRFLEYILKFGCLYALSLFMMLMAGPNFFTHHKELESKILSYNGVEEISLELINPFDTNYVKLNVTLSNKNTYSKIFRIKEREHLRLYDFLENYNVNTNNLKLTSFPITINDNRLKNIKDIRMSANGSKVIKTMIIDGNYILGKKISTLSKITFYVIGAVMILFGALIFLSGTNLLIRNMIIFSKTGDTPKLWNSVDNKIEGWKYILGLSNKKKDK